VRYLQSTPPFPALPDARDTRDKPPPAPLLAAAVHAQSEGVLILEKRWARKGPKIIFANESFCAMTGHTFLGLRALGLAALHTEDTALGNLKNWMTNLDRGTVFSGEGTLLRKDGTPLFAAWNYCPVHDERGRVTHIVATFRDLTEKRRLQEALIHSQRLDAVGRLAGGVAHDFNNLLSVINGYCEILATKAPVRRQASRELEEIHLASQKAATLVRQLLAFSRRQAMNPKVISLNQLVRDNADILSRLLKPARSLALSLDSEALHVRVDPAQLQQVLLNLTINARDALAEGGQVTLTTTLREITAAESDLDPDPIPTGRYAVLSVHDNGIGMDDQIQAHLFEPFFTTKEPGHGTGLGLALVYGVVQQSGGHIRVHSAPHRGSTFEIFLPEVREPVQTVSNTIPTLPGTRGRETILIVEEDDVIRKMVASILTADGYTVLSERTADEGLDIARRLGRPIDLLITQIGGAAGREGEKLIRDLQVEHPHVRVLATCNPDCVPADLIPAEAAACVIKPFALSALIKAVRTLLDAKK
jgi:two-component system, cell cycle sensor histidine kinase and response regulator CckA